jgi:hypothetical protein
LESAAPRSDAAAAREGTNMTAIDQAEQQARLTHLKECL